MTGRLQGKIALVTGASRGMGYAIAERFADEGAQVVMAARSKSELDEAAARIGSAALPLTCDIGDPNSVRQLFATVAEKFARPGGPHAATGRQT